MTTFSCLMACTLLSSTNDLAAISQWQASVPIPATALEATINAAITAPACRVHEVRDLQITSVVDLRAEPHACKKAAERTTATGIAVAPLELLPVSLMGTSCGDGAWEDITHLTLSRHWAWPAHVAWYQRYSLRQQFQFPDPVQVVARSSVQLTL